MLAALGRLHEVGLHVRAAIDNGVSVTEIQEVLLQAAIYGGVPAAVEAFGVAQEVLAELERTNEQRTDAGG
jgi:4-carboxymuconolactone decarboxylase